MNDYDKHISNWIKDRIKKKNLHENYIKVLKKYWDFNNFDGEIVETRFWDGMDNIENFKKNKKNIIYNISDIDYEINQYGYRTSKMTNNIFKENNIACFGCSNTFGTGLPWEETWPSVLNKLLGEDWSVKNYGVNGAPMDTISRLIYNYTLSNKPKVICCFLPEIYRMELFSDGFFSHFHLRYSDYQNKEVHDGYLKIMDNEYGLYLFIKNLKFIESICFSKNISLYWCTWDDEILNLMKDKSFTFFDVKNYLSIVENVKEFDFYPKARDNAHYGKNIHYKIAFEFSKKIKEIYEQ